MEWFWDNKKGLEEAAELQSRFPTLTLQLDRAWQRAIVTGTLTIAGEVGYSVTLYIPRRYPLDVPVLWCNPKEIPWKLDRHVYETTGKACLCARSEYRIHWPENSSLSDFIDRLVTPYFTGQFYFETHGCWPPTGQRPHGKNGIIEAYTELTTALGDSSIETIERLLRLLARKQNPKGHELCPCGSGLNLRKCHRQAVSHLRQIIQPDYASADLRDLIRTSAAQC